MSGSDLEATAARRGALEPLACLREGFAAIRPQYGLFVALTLAGLLLGSVAPLGILLGPMVCGIYVGLFRRMRGERVRFGVLAEGFRYFAPSFVATLVQIVPMMALTIPINLVFALGIVRRVLVELGPPYSDALELVDAWTLAAVVVVVSIVLFVVSVVVGAFFMFSYPLIVDRKLGGLAAVRASVRAARANVRGVMALMALTTALGMLGALACYVGALFAAPVTLAAWAVAYDRVFGVLGPADATAPPVA